MNVEATGSGTMRRMALSVALIAMLGCDPGYFKRFPVDDSSATSRLDQVLRNFETEHLGRDFFLVEVPDDLASDYRDRGYQILRWYDRDPVASSRRGSFFYLAVLIDIESARIELASVAFPSWGEPPELERIRRELTLDLCEHGFVVEDGCEG